KKNTVNKSIFANHIVNVGRCFYRIQISLIIRYFWDFIIKELVKGLHRSIEHLYFSVVKFGFNEIGYHGTCSEHSDTKQQRHQYYKSNQHPRVLSVFKLVIRHAAYRYCFKKASTS